MSKHKMAKKIARILARRRPDPWHAPQAWPRTRKEMKDFLKNS